MKTDQNRVRRLSMLSWVLYGLAVLLLIASILLGLSVSGASTAIPAATIGFQSPALKPVWDALVSGLQFLGMLVFGGGLVMAILLFGIGMLVGRVANLECRIRRLEGTAGADPDQPAENGRPTQIVPTTQVAHPQ